MLQNFADFSTVAHANHGIKEKCRKSVVVLTALRAVRKRAARLKSAETAGNMLFVLVVSTKTVMLGAGKAML
jgi:hypothetical protein